MILNKNYKFLLFVGILVGWFCLGYFLTTCFLWLSVGYILSTFFFNIVMHHNIVILTKSLQISGPINGDVFDFWVKISWFCLGHVLSTCFFNILGKHSFVILNYKSNISPFFGHHSSLILTRSCLKYMAFPIFPGIIVWWFERKTRPSGSCYVDAEPLDPERHCRDILLLQVGDCEHDF